METAQYLPKLSNRSIADPPADKAFMWLKSQKDGWSIVKNIRSNQSFYTANTGYGDLSELIGQMVMPSWADDKQIAAGQTFFEKHTWDIMAILGIYSLPYCYAGARGARVLIHSKKILSEPEKRLRDTAEFVLAIGTPGAFSGDGAGYASLLDVRLQHAGARFYTGKFIEDEVPVNQEDLTGTMLAFSLIVIRGLRKLGIVVSEAEAEAYLHLWRVVGYLLGIREELLPKNMREASLIERTIRRREFRYSEEGAILTKVLLDYYRTFDRLPFKPEDFMCFLMGGDVSKCLGLKMPTAFTLNRIEAVSRLGNLFKEFSGKRNDQELLTGIAYK